MANDNNENVEQFADRGSGRETPRPNWRNWPPISDELRQTMLRRQADSTMYRNESKRNAERIPSARPRGWPKGSFLSSTALSMHWRLHHEKEYEVYRKGFELIYKQLLDNVSRSWASSASILPGKMFDPHMHQAMDRLETSDHEDGTVVQTFQPGYVFNGRVLRPAMVRVAVNPTAASKKKRKRKT